MTAVSVRGLSVLLIPSKPGADEDNVNPLFEVLAIYRTPLRTY